MKNLLTVLAPIMLAAAAGPAWCEQPVNLLSNGGFESGLDGWKADVGHSLVAQRGQAHSGKACLSGEVTGPNRALRLRRTVPVKAGNRYVFEIWAKASNRTKLVLWVTQPGVSSRQSPASWDKLPRQWRRYSAPLSVTKSGMLELEIIAPSSFGAPAGRIWVDDIALYETEMPPLTLVSQGAGFNDEPAMALATDGSVYVAYNSFQQGADWLRIARYRPEGTSFEAVSNWQAVGGKGTCILGIQAVSAGDGVTVVYAAETNENWDIYALPCGPHGPARPVAVTSEAAVDVKPAAVWHDGTLWVAWESNRNGARQIFAASVREGRSSATEAVSRPDASGYDPSIALLDNGEMCVAWHGYRNNNYDIYLRRRQASGSWGSETRLTRSPSIDRHPLLVTSGNDLWLVFENAHTEQYFVGRTNRRRLVVAKVTPRGLLWPKTNDGRSPLDGRCEAAGAALDSQGRLWLAMLKPRLPRAGWDTYLTCLAGGRWLPAVPVSSQKGMDRPPSLALAGKRVLVAFQADTTPRSWSDLDRMSQSTSNIYLANLDAGSVPAGQGTTWEPLVESTEPFEPAQLHIQRGEDLPTPEISYRGKTLRLYFGDLHEHSDVSVCNRLGDQSIDESYQHMRDMVHHDFACVTDHGYNINPYLWSYTAKLARANHDPRRFLTFLGQEWTSTFEEYSEAHPYGFYGHRNLVFADAYFPRWWNARNRQTPAEVWEDLRKLNANFIHIPHQLADTGNVPTDWTFYDEGAQPVAEIFQTRGSYEYKGAPREAARTTPQRGSFIQDAWARGIVIGVIASPDHGGGYGKACVYAPELTREAILDAIRARHCYGTTAAKIFLDVRVEGHLMGEKVAAPAGKSVAVDIHTRCPADIDRIEVCRNNRFIYTTRPTGREANISFVDMEPLADRSYYYVRVVQKDEEIAWSSPVWFGAQ